jgi:arginine deiminase
VSVVERAQVPALRVDSEVGPLRRVIVHRPGPELERLTPHNRHELLFDDVIWVERAAEEHDALTAVLRSRGAEVLVLTDLLTETLGQGAARIEAAARTVAACRCGPTLAPALAAWLASLPADELTQRLIGGATFAEPPFPSRSLQALTSRPDAFVVPPLPNHLYTRDASAWAYGGVSVHEMATPARRREALHLELIYRHHPLFAGAEFELWGEGSGSSALEGGDLLVIGNGCLLAGISERSTAVAVERHAASLFAAGAARQVIAVELPRDRSTIHLDTVLTMVDRDAFTVYGGLRDRLRAFRLTPARQGVRAEPVGLFEAIREALELPELRLVETVTEREQWDEGNNVLALAPGVVVAYERNTASNACLSEHGIEVLTIPGSELARGRGGPRCMTCPIERAPLNGE